MQVCKFLIETYACQLGQMEHCSQGIASPSVLQSVVVEFVGLVMPVLIGEATKAMEETTSFLSAAVGHGKSQWHIFLISGGNIGSALFYGNGQLLDNVKFIHDKSCDL